MVGTATFVDKKNQLYGEVTFGKVPGKEDDALLQRTDAIRADIHQMSSFEPARATSPEPNSSSGSHVRFDNVPNQLNAQMELHRYWRNQELPDLYGRWSKSSSYALAKEVFCSATILPYKFAPHQRLESMFCASQMACECCARQQEHPFCSFGHL